MTQSLDSHTALAQLDWQIDLGATEAILDAPVNRYEAPDRLAPAPKTKAAPPIPTTVPDIDAVAEARAAASKAQSLEELHAALAAFEHCDLKRGARNLVFSDGHAAARVMIIGEAPGRDEDLQGKPFVGRAGQLLDKMLAAIGLSRQNDDPQTGTYITNVLPWRPPQNRDPKPEEIAMMRPFVQRHVDLVNPDILVLMGNISCDAGLGRRGITKLRGNWAEAYGKPTLPMFHPAYLLRNPAAKRAAWADLLDLAARLEGQS
ncbi:MAG: uracil-DNA glycosylase [Pseudomonadota bacterium]